MKKIAVALTALAVLGGTGFALIGNASPVSAADCCATSECCPCPPECDVSLCEPGACR